MPRFTISMAVHQNLALTKKAIESIFAHSDDFELFVTNNDSTDGTTEYLDRLQAEGKLLHIRKFQNTGFIKPHNGAINIANGKFTVIVNNDIEVPEGWLDKMAAEFNDHKVGIVGAKDSCQSLSPEGSGCRDGTLEYIEGSCLMIPTALARHHGLFDTIYQFGWFEDSDLSLRFRELGYKIAVADLRLHHNNGSTANLVRKEGKIDLDGYHLRNQTIFQQRWKRYLERKTFTKEILVSRENGVGDVMLVTPIVEALKQKYANSRITVMTRATSVFARNPNVVEVVEVVDDPRKYDLIYDLNMAYEKSPFKHIVDAYAEVCEVEREIAWVGHRPILYPSAGEEKWYEGLAGTGGPLVVVHPGPTGWEGRNWPAKDFSAVTRHFITKGYRVALIGSRDAAPVLHTIDLRQNTTLTGLVALLREAALFVGIDSSPMHAAVAADCALVAVFGCIDPKLRLPPDSPLWVRPVQAEGVACLGCHHWQEAPRVDSKCLRDRVYCMEKLTVDQVIVAAERAIAEKGQP